MKTCKSYRESALDVLRGKWSSPVITILVFMLINIMVNAVFGRFPGVFGDDTASGFASLFGCVLSALILLPLQWSVYCIFLKFYRTQGEEIRFEELFDGFRDFTRIFGTLFLKNIYIGLWAILLIVPGIIKSFSYAMTEYILKDNPELSYNEAIEKSMAMMKGHKMQLFCLQLSFVGWGLLCILTLGIGFLWLYPYINTSMAIFYEDLKAESLAEKQL